MKSICMINMNVEYDYYVMTQAQIWGFVSMLNGQRQVQSVSFPAWPISAGPTLQWVFIILSKGYYRQPQRPRGLRCESAAARLLGLWVRIPQGHVCFSLVTCLLSGRGLCVRPITCPEESSRVWSWILDNEEALAHWGLLRHGKKKIQQADTLIKLFT